MRVFQWVGRVAVGLVAAAGLALVILLVVVPRTTGAVPLTVLTGSMTPTIPVGSVVLVRPVDPMSLRPGDVITFQSEPGVEQYVTHRVVRFQPETSPPSYITKGDANRGDDIDPVPLGAVRGKVWFHVPYVGTASTLLHGPAGPGLLAAGTGLLLFAWLAHRTIAAHHRWHRAAPSAEPAPVHADRSARLDAAGHGRVDAESVGQLP